MKKLQVDSGKYTGHYNLFLLEMGRTSCDYWYICLLEKALMSSQGKECHLGHMSERHSLRSNLPTVHNWLYVAQGTYGKGSAGGDSRFHCSSDACWLSVACSLVHVYDWVSTPISAHVRLMAAAWKEASGWHNVFLRTTSHLQCPELAAGRVYEHACTQFANWAFQIRVGLEMPKSTRYRRMVFRS